jgi:CubicO group peptidase (beta-lactamase class C family)
MRWWPHSEPPRPLETSGTLSLVNHSIRAVLALTLAAAPPLSAAIPARSPAIQRLDRVPLTPAQVDATVELLMKQADVPGLALALIDKGRPVYVKAYGFRNVVASAPLETETVMYGASLTKLAFAYMVMQLVAEHRLKLDKPIARYLPKPLPDYPKYADLAADPRWKKLTARMLLDHTAGFPNFRFVNADGKLDFKFEPGTRYAYSGEGINLLQFVLETGLGLDAGKEMQRRVFDRFGMTRTSMTWRDDFAGNLADGYAEDGKVEGHHQRGSVRAAGSMDTTIRDYANFLAGLVRGDGLSPASRKEMMRAQIAITAAHQFPTLEPAVDPTLRSISLAAGLGSVVFRGPYGPAFYKGGHDDWTGNMAICVEARQRCIVLLSNSVHAEKIYPQLVDAVFGSSGIPWRWEYNPPVEPKP